MNNPIPKLTEALIAAQREFQPALKESVNPHFKSRYVDLAGVWNACRDALHTHGLTVVQTVATAESGSILRSILLHVSGEQIASEYPLQPIKNDPQGLGSAMTYARRYSLAALVGIAPEDDDGESGSCHQHQHQHQQRNDRAPGSQPSTNQGNAPAAQRQPAQGAAPASSTAPTTPTTSTAPTTATTSTTKATAAEDAAAERLAKANYDANRASLPGTAPQATMFQERSNKAFGELAKHGEKTARMIWKAAADWKERAAMLEGVLAGVLYAVGDLGEDEAYKLLDRISDGNGWPDPSPDQIRAIAHDMAALKPAHAEVEG